MFVFVAGAVDARIMQKPSGTEALLLAALLVTVAGVQRMLWEPWFLLDTLFSLCIST